MFKYGNKDTIDLLNNFKDYDTLIDYISDCFNSDDSNDKIKSVRSMLIEYENKPELREGIDLCLIALTGYCLGTILENILKKQLGGN